MTSDAVMTCQIKRLPEDLWVPAAQLAVEENPVNRAPSITLPDREPLEPMHLAVLTRKYWQPTPRVLTVSFLDNPTVTLRDKIVAYANKWADAGCCVSFAYTAAMDGDVRVTREDDGYWSYLGTDIHLVPKNEQTMNLARFTDSTSTATFERVVVHEFGHTLAFPHEHLRAAIIAGIDPDKAYAYFARTQGWDQATTHNNVLRPLEAGSIMGSDLTDVLSVMCYSLPAEIMKPGVPGVTGGARLSDTDKAHAAKVYPKPAPPPPPPPKPTSVWEWLKLFIQALRGTTIGTDKR